MTLTLALTLTLTLALSLSLTLTRGGAACAQVLQTHRNWEWAIRYVLIESADYAQVSLG